MTGGREWYLCIHGHFYQPPRENPWLEQIELQESASPFHDWNERIYYECYLPNAMARVLDSRGEIVGIINNFEGMSFNVGPTLMSWLAEKHPDTYRQIIDADRKSWEVHDGHGNAIAQVYNHMIMPLAIRRDKITQVRWGLEDFRSRFGRDPESMWVPETAVNEETLEVLVEEGMKYIIMAPHQAQAVKPLPGDGAPIDLTKDWQDVSSGQIDPKQPYRCYLKNYPTKYIDIFFYDGPVSNDVGFGPLLFDAKHFMDRIESAKVRVMKDKLINVSTDGETFGHHKAFGDRALAYVLNVEAPKRGCQIVNYGEFLAIHPPKFAVRLKEGENGEGTAWSCAHGVKRWKDHCGCRGDGPAEWTQHWRKPLRDVFDWLRDELAKVFEAYGERYLKDVWTARNEYISVVLDRSENNIRTFFKKHAKFDLNQEEIVICLKLLEMQRHTMLMYTSCGWFFTEISGIEGVQILTYAVRAVELAGDITKKKSLEEDFLKHLTKIKSNRKDLVDGMGVYERLVKPRIVTLQHIVSFYAISSSFNRQTAPQGELSLYCYNLQVMRQRREAFGNFTLNFGKVKLTSKITLEENEFAFIVIQLSPYDFRCSVMPYSELKDPEVIEKELMEGMYSMHIIEVLRRIDTIFGERYYSLRDLPVEQRIQIVSILTKEMIEKIRMIRETLYDDNRRINEVYRSMNLPIPAEIRDAAEQTLERRLTTTVAELANRGFDPGSYAALDRIIEDAKLFDVKLKKTEVFLFLSLELEKRARGLLKELRPEFVIECLNIHKLAKKIDIQLDQRKTQDCLFFLLKKWHHDASAIPENLPQCAKNMQLLLDELHINTDEFMKILQRYSTLA